MRATLLASLILAPSATARANPSPLPSAPAAGAPDGTAPPQAPPSAEAAAPSAVASPVRPERPEAMVRAIYRALDGKNDGLSPLDWTEPETARALFVPGLAALAVAEGERAVPDRRLPFDPFTGALQIRPGQVGLRVVSTAERKAEVMARFLVSGAVRTVSYRLVEEDDGWRIADIWWGTDKRRSFARLLR